MVGEGASPNEPICRHNGHSAFDLITLNENANPIVPYATTPAIARLLGVYPVGLFAACLRREGGHRCTKGKLGDILGDTKKEEGRDMDRRNHQASLVFRVHTDPVSLPNYVNPGGREAPPRHRVACITMSQRSTRTAGPTMIDVGELPTP